MATTSTESSSGRSRQSLSTDRLRGEFQNLINALGERAVGSVRDRVGGVTDRLADYAEGKGGSGLTAAVTGARQLAEGKSPARAVLSAGTSVVKDKVKSLFGGGGKGGKGKKTKITNIIESIDVGVPVRVAYNQWTQFRDFPSFMKKVENVDQESDEKLRWKAQIFWSHRSWESTIINQVPDDKIVWRSQGDKGYVNGAVTFHPLAPNLTRVLMVLEYHPQGLFEHTGNLWRAQGRRARLELKHFRRHVMSDAVLHADDIEGWRGTIEDGQVVKDHETAVREERKGGGKGEDSDGQPRRRRAGSSRGGDDESESDESNGQPRRRRASSSRSSSSEDGAAERRPARRSSSQSSEGSSSRTRSSSRSRAGASRSRASRSSDE